MVLGLGLAGPATARAGLGDPLTGGAGMAAQPGAITPAKPSPLTSEADNPPIHFSADTVEYDDSGDVGMARGNVVVHRADRQVRADSLKWDRRSGKITAEGNVRIIDADGNQLFTGAVELTDQFDIGAINDLLVSLRAGGRLAALRGTRQADGKVRLERVVYTGCDTIDDDGCDKRPSWKILARRATYDPDRKVIRFDGARLDFFGLHLPQMPPIFIATDGRAISGLLIPDLRLSTSNGAEISETWYQKIAANRDLSVTAYLFSQTAPMASFDYRALGVAGAYDVTGYLTRSSRIDTGTTTGTSQTELRGYLSSNGHFQLSPGWSVDYSGRVVTDRTFLKRYYINNDDILRSTFAFAHTDDSSYLSISGWAFQTLRTTERQGLVPVALPEIDYRRRFEGGLPGAVAEIQLNTLAISRSAGQDTQRAFASARWDMRRYGRWGEMFTLTALLRGDLYHSVANSLTTTTTYQGLPGWQARAVGVAAADIAWPFVGPLLGGTQVLTPHLQVVVTPSLRNLAIPNEDARAIELADTNIFALNRFPGYDRVEDGTRFTYGFDWQLDRPGWRVNASLGQSFRLTERPTLLPPGTGLNSRQSDFVGRTELRYGNFLKLTHRYRLDKDSLAFRRNEIDATVGTEANYLEVGYARLNRQIAAAIEDLQDSNELRAAGRLAFARHWSLFGSGVFDLSGQNLSTVGIAKPSNFQPLRTRLGFAFQNNCVDVAFTWRRDFITVGDATKGSSFLLHFALRNLGVR
ncbi:MAG: LPS-assembly protein LptD [Proteobacteria bacterium]|nr:LPS-assembly protein LptD [Pseudomonadota bacterium]